MTKTTKLVYMSLLISQALVLSKIESLIPVPFLMPGAKLGLANIVTMIAIYTLGYKKAFTVLSIRILLSVFFAGSMSKLMYSLGGASFSFIFIIIFMIIFKENISIIGISIVGAVFHNIGQILVAILILESSAVIFYMPILILIAIPTGIFIGFCSKYILLYLKKLNLTKYIN